MKWPGGPLNSSVLRSCVLSDKISGNPYKPKVSGFNGVIGCTMIKA